MKKKNLILVLLVVFTLLYTLIPTAYRTIITPKDRVYLGMDGYMYDYYLLLSFVKQGEERRILRVNKYNNITSVPNPIHFEYLWAGYVGRLLNFDTPVIYHLFRLSLNLIFLLLSLSLIKKIFPQWTYRVLAFVMAFLVGGFPDIGYFKPPNPLDRLFVSPHHIIGKIGTVLIFILIFEILRNKKRRYFWIILLVSSFLIALVHTTSIMVIMGALIFLSILSFIPYIKISLKKILPVTMVVGFGTLAAYLFINYFFGSVPELKAMAIGEKVFSIKDKKIPNLALMISFFRIMVIPLSLAVIGIYKAWKKERKILFLFLGYLLSNLLFLLYFYSFLGMSRMRFYQTPFFLPLAILSVYGVMVISSFIRNRIKVKKDLITLLIIIISLLLSTPSYIGEIKAETTDFVKEGFDKTVFVPKEDYEALLWLKSFTRSSDTVLSLYQIGAIIPAISGNFVFQGNPNDGLDFDKRFRESEDFFYHKMADPKGFLVSKHIAYVWYEKGLPSLSDYPFLIRVFVNDKIEIYKVINNGK